MPTIPRGKLSIIPRTKHPHSNPDETVVNSHGGLGAIARNTPQTENKARRSVSTPVSHLVFKPISVSSLVELVEDSVLRTLTDRKQNTQGMQPSKATVLTAAPTTGATSV